MTIQKKQPSKAYETEFIIIFIVISITEIMGIDKKSEEAGKESKRHTGYKSSPLSLSFIPVI